MYRLYILLFLMMGSSGLMAQHACDGLRYIDTVFSSVDLTTDVFFGNGTTINGANQDLYMDIYEPAGDTLSQRPVVVLAFGGSFILGSRQDLDNTCRYYAERGYVAVTIDYRLYDKLALPSANDMIDVVVKAVSDMKAAVRYLREDAATNNFYRIDTSLIFVGGISAGGIVANHTAYLDSTDNYDSTIANAISANGGWEGNSSSNYQYSSAVQGVINFSGALRTADYIDANDPPLFSAHDDDDGTVPYGVGSASVFGLPIIGMEGSGVMHSRADSLGINNFLITIPNSNGHVSYFAGGSSWRDTVEQTSAIFMEEIICANANPSLVVAPITTPSSRLFPNPATNHVQVELSAVPSAYQVTLLNTMGQVVYQQSSLMDAYLQIPRQNLAAGMYVLQIRFEEADLPLIQHKVIFR